MIQDFYYLWLTFLLSFFPQLAQFYFSRYKKDGPFYTPLKFMKYKGYYFKDVYVLTEKGLRFFIESFE